MAVPTRELISALRDTAVRLRGATRYQWTHMGACNCGHLAQTVTRLTPAQIHAYATERAGDWADQAREYCGGTGYPIDAIFDALLDLGLDVSDLAALERLSDPTIRREVTALQHLDYRNREHVVLYLEAWAAQLAARLGPARDQRAA